MQTGKGRKRTLLPHIYICVGPAPALPQKLYDLWKTLKRIEGGRLNTTRRNSLRLLPLGPDRIGDTRARVSLPGIDISAPDRECNINPQ